MKKKLSLRERLNHSRANRNISEAKGFTYNNLAKMDSESRFEAILKYIKSLDSKNKSHQIILGEIAGALRGFYPKYAFKEVQVIADLAAKGFISRKMERELASYLPMNEARFDKLNEDYIASNKGVYLELENMRDWKQFEIIAEVDGIGGILMAVCEEAYLDGDIVSDGIPSEHKSEMAVVDLKIKVDFEWGDAWIDYFKVFTELIIKTAKENGCDIITFGSYVDVSYIEYLVRYEGLSSISKDTPYYISLK